MPKKLTQEEFITRYKKIHNNKYIYDKVIYKNSKTEITITCPIHGDFPQLPLHHLYAKCGCKKCADEEKRMTQENFLKRAKQIHGDKYDYSKTKYINSSTEITITCPIHGDFSQLPYNHLAGNKCPHCSREEQRYTKEQFIEKAKQIHGDKYDYTNTVYINNSTKLMIFCKKCKKEFPQFPFDHMDGHGCPVCNHSIGSSKKSKLSTKINGRFHKRIKVYIRRQIRL